jgi:Ni/Co efflux regulator RcnB
METTVFKKLVPVLSLGLMFLAAPMVFAQGASTSGTAHTSKMKSHHHTTHHAHHSSKSHHHKMAKKAKKSS